MARGNLAKEQVNKIIEKAFGPDYITIDGSKIYVWAQDGNERVQIALTMTCPKTPIETGNSNHSNEPENVFDNYGAAKAPAPANDMTQQEQETIRALMERLGL